jgi:CheY-like chemotaxis protein
MTDVPSSQAGSAAILVAEEEVLVRFAVADYLRACGYRVIEVASGEEALLTIRTSEVKFDAVLCDAELPFGLKRFDLAQWIRSHRTGAPPISS